MSYNDVADRLTPEAEQLIIEMVEAHLGAAGDRLFMLSESMAGADLILSAGRNRSWKKIDRGALEDLVRYGLIDASRSRSGRTPHFRVGGEAIRFHRWLLQRSGAAVAQAEEKTRHLIDSAAFARLHPGAAHHLDEATSLLWGGNTDDQTISEIGDHLRKAVMDLTSSIVGDDGGSSEQPIQRLEGYLARSALGDREKALVRDLVALVRSSLRLDHRLNHIRDETDKGLPLRGWDEARRATLVTTLACAELALALR